MGTFFRVIYTKILYRIPLKYLLIFLAVVAVCIASFSNADYIGTLSRTQSASIPAGNSLNLVKDYVYCIYKSSAQINLVRNFSGDTTENSLPTVTGPACFDAGTFIQIKNKGTSSAPALIYTLSDDINDSVLSGYIIESSIDSQYCVSNNLCPSNVLMTENQCKSIYGLISSNSCPEVPECPDNPNVGTSNLYINDVFHPGAFNVVINIPEEIDRDYAYTNSGSNFNLDVVGYNQDTEYIQSLIDVNSYKPTSEDFTSVFSLFGEYGGLLVACLFVILLFYFIKRAFK